MTELDPFETLEQLIAAEETEVKVPVPVPLPPLVRPQAMRIVATCQDEIQRHPLESNFVVQIKVMRADLCELSPRRVRVRAVVTGKSHGLCIRGDFVFQIFCLLDQHAITQFQMPLYRSPHQLRVKALNKWQRFDRKGQCWHLWIPVPQHLPVCSHVAVRITHPQFKPLVVRAIPGRLT